MKPVDILIIIIIAAACFLAIRRLVINKRQGKLCSGCSADCSCCTNKTKLRN